MTSIRVGDDAVIVDRFGAIVVLTHPREELAVVVDLGGRRNKTETGVEQRYLLSPGQAGELIADLVRVVCASGSQEARVALVLGLGEVGPR